MINAKVVLDGAATGDEYALVDVKLPAGARLHPHVLTREDLTVVLMDGTLAVHVDGAKHLLEAGDSLDLPRRASRNATAVTDVRLLVLSRPAGLETLAELTLPPLLEPDDVAARLTVSGVTLLPKGRM